MAEKRAKKTKAVRSNQLVKSEKLKKREKTKTGDRAKKGFHLSLKAQLIIGFLLPLILVVSIGIYAYDKAESGMVNNYREASMQALQMTADYMDFGFEAAWASALEINSDATFVNYFQNKYKDDADELETVQTAIFNNIRTKKLANKFIAEIYLVPNSGIGCISSIGLNVDKPTDGFLTELKEEYGDIISAQDKVDRWAYGHELIDEIFAVTPGQTMVSLYLSATSAKGCIVIDISSEKIMEIMQDTGLGEGSIVGFVTADGHEILTGLTEDGAGEVPVAGFSFLDKEYYQAAVASEESSYSEDVRLEGREYCFMASRCEQNNALLCALIPKSVMMTEANELKTAVFLFVIFACIFVGVLGVLIVFGISKNMNRIIHRLSKVASGDLTVDMTIKNKSEFGMLARHIMGVVSNTKNLVTKVVSISQDVSTSASDVAQATGVLSNGTQDIYSAINEIDQGVNRQVEDAGQCLEKMDELSDIILTTEQNVVEMGRLADGTKSMIDAGSGSMETLIQHADETIKMTDQVGEKIEMLAVKSREIAGFVDTINEISSQTTLLSLNASIEAARAGEAGKGFAVVAEEIKKLADNSMQAAEEIRKVVDVINEMTAETKKSSVDAKAVVEKQGEIVEHTRQTFADMNDSVAGLLDNVRAIQENMQKMSNGRGETLSAIESISSVVQQTAASASLVNATATEQMKQAEALSVVTEELQSKTEELMEAISRFTV
ncbi:MAG: methyl-accepting chemotaxis protein [Lachnospiraceae bacterium]